MSESPREWRFYVGDMVQFCEKVLQYTANIDQATFVADAMRYDATVRNLELLGEAATRIPEPVRAAHASVPWRLIVATRNRLIHGYLGIDNDTLWSVIQTQVPRLLQQLRTIQQEPAP
jgi:uncharacterized protein with HEPN domain